MYCYCCSFSVNQFEFDWMSMAGACKAFICSFCNQQYRYKKNLLKHQRYECGKEPQFACPLCSYRAKQKGNLKTHLFIKHGSAGLAAAPFHQHSEAAPLSDN
ncbi:hypothetical protein J6590_014848 [Homalodisca vitripennis]|nr:hypothetical protein J6590_014848 [Homalodisca vitripennis]